MANFRALHKQYIDGEWRDGKSQNILKDYNPYNGEIIAEFKMASKEDVDLAYKRL
ncbi:hypothetical protein GCM10010965_20880 [Caldalkalibacillus thermarum]|nr:hypothetical protein GCM10010965_20880 [Caldalkalibacillus thermarum]